MNTTDLLESENNRSEYARKSISSELRIDEGVKGWIDTGYIHHRAIYTILETRKLTEKLEPRLTREEQRPWHASKGFYTGILIEIARMEKAENLISVANTSLDNLCYNQLICSTDCFKGTEFKNKDTAQVLAKWEPPSSTKRTVDFRFRPEYIFSSTSGTEMRKGALVSHISLLKEFTEETLVIEPLIIGGPCVQHNNENLNLELAFHSINYYEIFVDDIYEFSKVKDIPRPEPETWKPFMKKISENVVKSLICQLLCEKVEKDWGGETSDVFSSNIHLGNKRTTRAFLLTGPSDFHPMKARHLGKNGDQIYRLSQEPAELLVVQHSHEVTEAVRATLRAFSSQIWSQRRFMIIDGSDTYRLLKAYKYF